MNLSGWVEGLFRDVFRQQINNIVWEKLTSNFDNTRFKDTLPKNLPIVLRDDRYDGDAGVDSKVEAAFFERKHVGGLEQAPGTFGIHPERNVVFLHLLSSSFNGTECACAVTAVDEDGAGQRHERAQRCKLQ